MAKRKLAKLNRKRRCKITRPTVIIGRHFIVTAHPRQHDINFGTFNPINPKHAAQKRHRRPINRQAADINGKPVIRYRQRQTIQRHPGPKTAFDPAKIKITLNRIGHGTVDPRRHNAQNRPGRRNPDDQNQHTQNTAKRNNAAYHPFCDGAAFWFLG